MVLFITNLYLEHGFVTASSSVFLGHEEFPAEGEVTRSESTQPERAAQPL
jgi:hypothetical protein